MRRRSQWLAKAGLRVFSFDYTGCYGSAGRSCRGFPQAADDLRAALRFLEENGRFGSRRLVLLGHSMGGYAVCCALPGSRVDAAVCIGGVNGPMEATLSPVLHHIGVQVRLCALSGAVPLSGRALRTARPAPHRRTGLPPSPGRRCCSSAACARLDRSAAPQLHSRPSACAAAGAGPALRPEPEHDGHADLLFGATRSEAEPRPHGTDHPLPPPRKIRRNEKKLLTIFYPADIIAELSGNAAIAQQVERGSLVRVEVSSSNLDSSSRNLQNLWVLKVFLLP